MSAFLPLVAVLALTFAANRVTASPNTTTDKRFTWFLVLLNIPLFLAGILFVLAPVDSISLLEDAGLPLLNIKMMGIILTGMGIWAFLCSWEWFRGLLARFMPLAVDSAVHLTALILAGYLVGNTALALSQDILQQLEELELAVSTVEIVLQQAGFTLLALAGTGLFVRRDIAAIGRRLGLLMPTSGQLGIGVLVIVLLLIMQGTVGVIWSLIDPLQAEQLGNINEALLANFDSPSEWLVLAIASGIGEEMLFRGALQPVFGLPVTSLLFAVVHIQYGLTPITVLVFLLGVVLGLVRRFTNTTVAIFVHFGYNFSLGILSMLALYLEQFVTP